MAASPNPNDPFANLPDTGRAPVARAVEPEKTKRQTDDNDDDDYARPRSRRRLASRSRRLTKGVLPREQVRFFSFVSVTMILLLGGIVSIMAVWGAASAQIAWRAVTTLAILGGIILCITVLNESFGTPIDSDND